LDIRTNQVFTANFQKLAYSFTNTTAYNIYRLQIDRVANPAQAVAMQLDELEFMVEPAPYSYFWSFQDGTTSTNQNPQHTYTSNGTYTPTLIVSEGLTTATNTITLSLAPPSLNVLVTPDGQLKVSWPVWADGYILYSTTNLVPPVIWAPITNRVTTGDIINASIAATIGARFFRLSNQ